MVPERMIPPGRPLEKAHYFSNWLINRLEKKHPTDTTLQKPIILVIG